MKSSRYNLHMCPLPPARTCFPEAAAAWTRDTTVKVPGQPLSGRSLGGRLHPPGCLKLTLVHTCGVVHRRDIVARGKAGAIKGVVLCSPDAARKSERQSDKIA